MKARKVESDAKLDIQQFISVTNLSIALVRTARLVVWRKIIHLTVLVAEMSTVAQMMPENEK